MTHKTQPTLDLELPSFAPFDDLPDLEGAQEPTPIPAGDEDLCRALWLAVIVQAVNDANSKRSRPCHQEDRKDALAWLNGSGSDQGKDFEKVCELAGVDPIKLRRIIAQALAGKHDGFNFRSLTKHTVCSRRGDPEDRRSYFKRLRKADARRHAKLGELSVEDLLEQCSKSLR